MMAGRRKTVDSSVVDLDRRGSKFVDFFAVCGVGII